MMVIKAISYLNIQDPQKKKMTQILDPEGGFRCIAQAVRGDESCALKDGICEGIMDKIVVANILKNFVQYPPEDCWFEALDCPQIVADVYNRAVAVYSETDGNVLYPPLRSEAPEVFKK
ncbi:uncharacterized protein BYT42DRAFT_547926 [Radiomyces spectabilis]|uniref:uncharacterized protein n=1 Tax=Radiomyces spectabilis TaxID=64574 RepID=UPI00221FC54A|nr:uncharacterized protein BYT42DRAFT_547926 [Radiomyces spectabilis]KAI8372890.1 hypothetical protein BYT42DRAFT_547926 [Radiomyces spectabilis]